MICSIEGCNRPVLVKSRGWCAVHYQRWQKHGDPLTVLPKGRTAEELDAYRALRRPPTPVICGHPERKHYAKGLCSPCYQKQCNKPWRDANRRRLANHARASKHGLKLPELEAIWATQAGKCANPRCTATFPLEHPDNRNGLQIDHDHATGKVRGLLCKPCNTALGHMHDDLDRLRGLIEYLEAAAWTT